MGRMLIVSLLVIAPVAFSRWEISQRQDQSARHIHRECKNSNFQSKRSKREQGKPATIPSGISIQGNVAW